MKKSNCLLFSVMAAALMAMGNVYAQSAPTLDQLLSGPVPSQEADGVPPIRFNAIRDAAMSYGAQAGLAYQTEQHNEMLKQRAQMLDKIYSFSSLMLEGNVIPPVLGEVDGYFEMGGDNSLVIREKSYMLHSQARFSYSAPNWRTYLVRSKYNFDPKSMMVQVSIQSDKEKALWAQFVKEGYEAGQEQAKKILREAWNELSRDFKGMVLYHELLSKNLVTRPYVAQANVGTTGDKKKNMNLGEMVFRISAMPEFLDPTKPAKDTRSLDVQKRLEGVIKTVPAPVAGDRTGPQ